MKFSKELLALLKKASTNPRELAKAAPVLCRAHAAATVMAMRGPDGAALSAEAKRDLLARAVAKEDVSLELDVLAYEQQPGKTNRNFVRFRDGAMQSLGRSGKGTPFLRNHDQYDVQARAGTVLSSSTEKLMGAEGHAIHQTVKLTAPWAVEMALRGLLDTVSIGWNPTGNVMCSACDAPIFTQCYHCPGDTLSEETLSNGKKGRLKYDANGDITVEWIFTEAELVETSVVNVPGVPSARIEEVRAALSAAFPGLRSEQDHEGVEPTREEKMNEELLKLLGLGADATPEQVLAAIQAKLNAAEADKAKLAIVQTDLSKYQADITELKADKAKRDEDTFVGDALATGRISKGEESNWRRLFKADQKGAIEEMAKRQPNSATPVGAPTQSANDPTPAPDPVITGGEKRGALNSLKRQLAAAHKVLATHPKAALFANQWFGLDVRGGDATRLSGATAIAGNADIDAARIAFHVALLENFGAEDDPVGMMATEVPSTKKVEEYDWMGDLPDFKEWKGERDLVGLEAFKLRMSARLWQNGLRIKNTDIQDDALGLLPSSIADLGSNARFHRFDYISKKLINGFDGVTVADVGDGLAYDDAFFFSAAHRGGNDNLITTGHGWVPFGTAAVALMNLKLRRMKRYDSVRPYRAKLTHVFVGPKNEDTALKIATQDYLVIDGVMQSNPYKSRFQFIVSDLIDGAFEDYYFGADFSRPIKPFLLQMRQDILTSAVLGGQGTQNDSYQRFMFNELLFGAEARYDVGYFEPRTIVGARP